jgi:hypothetical protein
MTHKNSCKCTPTDLEEVENWEIKDCLKKVKEGKARGPDELVGEQIKRGGTELWNWIIQLIKGVFRHAVTLDITNQTWIKPIVKDKRGNLEDSNNYRGISLISVWTKLVDSIILNKINSKFKTTGNQFGFKKGLSTKMAVQVVVEMADIYCKKGGSMYCGFVDIKKAFDRLDNEKIWEKMTEIGMGWNIIKMVKTQYENQVKKVIWEHGVSKPFSVNIGIRQGSPLSPMLFTMVIDEVIEKISKMKVGCKIKGKILNIIVYADDIVVLGPTKHAVESILKVLVEELKKKGLELNTEKTVLMGINKTGNKREGRNINIAGKTIKWVDDYKFLGVWINKELKWEKQLKEVGSKLNKLGNMILHQVGNVVGSEDKSYLLETCAFDLYGIEFCVENKIKQFKDVEKSYHWLVKRSIGYSKFASNHIACMDSGLMTWENMIHWKRCILWDSIRKSENEIIKLVFGNSKWETMLGKQIRMMFLKYGKEIKTAKEFKSKLKLITEGIGTLKRLDEMERESETEDEMEEVE